MIPDKSNGRFDKISIWNSTSMALPEVDEGTVCKNSLFFVPPAPEEFHSYIKQWE